MPSKKIYHCNDSICNINPQRKGIKKATLPLGSYSASESEERGKRDSSVRINYSIPKTKEVYSCSGMDCVLPSTMITKIENQRRYYSVLSNAETSEIKEIKETIKEIDWEKLAFNWRIAHKERVNSPQEDIIDLNPHKDCSDDNPLYEHEGWLKQVYYDPDLDLSMRDLCKICQITMVKLQKYFDKYGLIRKKYSELVRAGYKELYMPPDYLHPELKGNNIGRMEHIVIMEEYINSHRDLGIGTHGITDNCLIKGKNKGKDYYFIKVGYEIHHINFIRLDNNINNLWIFSKEQHGKVKGTLYNCFKYLIKLNQIYFIDGIYYLNRDFDYRKESPSIIEEVMKPIEREILFPFSDIKNLRNTIRDINWDDITDWEIPFQSNWNAPLRKLKLDPKKECSKENPLYLFKLWMERILTDDRFNLSDNLIGEICGITGTHIQRVRKDLGIAKTAYRAKRVITNKNYILIDLPDDYGNPFAIKQKSTSKRRLLEHRYIMERYLAELLLKTSQFSEHELRDFKIARNCLVDGKYLKPCCEVHHINLDGFDNRIENLWITQSKDEHLSIHSTLLELVNELLNLGFLIFKNEEYSLDIS